MIKKTMQQPVCAPKVECVKEEPEIREISKGHLVKCHFPLVNWNLKGKRIIFFHLTLKY